MKIVKIIIVALVLGAITAGLFGCANQSDEKTGDSRVATVARGDLLLDISAAGNLALSHTEEAVADLFYQQGTITEVLVDKGDAVTEGQVIARLDPDEVQDQITILEKAVTSAQNQVEVREAALEAAEQQVTNREDAVVAAERPIPGLKLQVRQAEIDLEAAQYALENITEVKEAQELIDYNKELLVFIDEKLIESRSPGADPLDWTFWTSEKNRVNLVLAQAIQDRNDIISENRLVISSSLAIEVARKKLAIERAELALNNAQTAVSDALAAVEDAGTALETARDNVAEARADVDEASQDVADARQELEEARNTSPEITAPISGYVTAINVKGGTRVVNGTVIAKIADPDKFEANILVSEMDILQVKVGDSATIQADAISDMVFPASVTRVAPAATIQSGVVNYAVTVELESLKPIAQGMADRRQEIMDKLASGELPERLQQAVDEGRMTREQAEQVVERIRSGDFSPPEGFRPPAGGGRPEGRPPPGGLPGNFGGSGGGGERDRGQLPEMTMTGFQLREGLTVTVSIIVAERKDVLFVPNGAVTREGARSFVDVVTADGETERRAVQVGISDWQNTEITGGLEEGEQIIVPLNVAATTSSPGPPGRPPRMGLLRMGR